MHSMIFANIRKAMSASPKAVDSAAIEKSLGATTSTEIQHLSIKEYSAVSGGPQVQNDPQQ
ncbi:hypothetical protein LPN04_12135 [Rugamonas sp. A1-17]|nr:hypothetical protein [Rugamonas sp. A1-17]